MQEVFPVETLTRAGTRKSIKNTLIREFRKLFPLETGNS